jgi:phosphate binding protein
MVSGVKRASAGGLLLALVIPILAACGGGTTNAPAAQATTPPVAATTAPAPTAPAATAPAATAPAATAPAATAPAATAAPAATTAAPAAGAVTLPEVDPAAVTGNIITAGSSTVFPLTQAMAKRFTDEGYAGQVTVDSIGTGGGFERFCVAGETDIANASRAIRDEEVTNCQGIGRTPIEFRVGTDALAVVVNPQNTFVENLTIEQLARIFSGELTTWSAVNPAWPNEQIRLFSPGSDSGTFDYFVEEVMDSVFVTTDADEGKGEEALLRAPGIQFSENDAVLVQGVEGSPFAIGYFGYAYFAAEGDKLKAVKVDDVEPNLESVEGGDYPLARPLFIYSDAKIIQEKPQVAAFINFYLSFVNEEIDTVGYFPASAEALDEAKQKLLDATQ